MDQITIKGHGIGWLDPVKAFALLAIMLNHFVEEFGRGPWFTHPSSNWPDFASRIARIWPTDHAFPISLLQFVGWLGDSAPGVFIVASGFGLAWSALHRSGKQVDLADFYKRRLVRIFPLYITAHFVILAGSLLVAGNESTLASPKTMLSLLGLRFTSSLFFYINPSWWFVWLILQLYLVFPYLYTLLNRYSKLKFLFLTCGFTVCCNLCGIILLRQSASLYYYMMGMFFGTRLAEFCLGMVLALLVRQANDRAIPLPTVKHIFCYSAAAYVVGFGLSLTWPGALVSTPLVSVGMAGIFYCAWEGFFRKIPLFSYILLWIGIESYAIYLIHQTPLKWTSAFFQGTPHVIAAALVLACSFPAGYLLRRTVDGIRQNLPQIRSSFGLTKVSFIVSLAILCTLVLVEPCINNPLYYRAFALLLGLVCTALVYIEFIQPEQEKAVLRSVRWSALFGSFIKLFVLPQGMGPESVFIGMLFGLGSLLIYLKFRRRDLSWTLAFLMLLAGCLGSEYLLKKLRPLETCCWGELPALQAHATRTYSLKPNKLTHLKYNNYDYMVKTNSMGLASPEIPIERPTRETFRILILGNAFTMPEGLPYEEAYPAILQSELSNYFKPRDTAGNQRRCYRLLVR